MAALFASALAISTICCWPMPSSFTGRLGSTARPTRSRETPSSARTHGKSLVMDFSSNKGINRSAEGAEEAECAESLRLLRPLIPGDVLVDVFELVVAVLDHGGEQVVLVDRDRLQQDAGHVLPAVLHRLGLVGDRLLPGEQDGHLRRLAAEERDRLVDRHRLRARHDALAGG